MPSLDFARPGWGSAQDVPAAVRSPASAEKVRVAAEVRRSPSSAPRRGMSVGPAGSRVGPGGRPVGRAGSRVGSGWVRTSPGPRSSPCRARHPGCGPGRCPGYPMSLAPPWVPRPERRRRRRSAASPNPDSCGAPASRPQPDPVRTKTPTMGMSAGWPAIEPAGARVDGTEGGEMTALAADEFFEFSDPAGGTEMAEDEEIPAETQSDGGQRGRALGPGEAVPIDQTCYRRARHLRRNGRRRTLGFRHRRVARHHGKLDFARERGTCERRPTRGPLSSVEARQPSANCSAVTVPSVTPLSSTVPSGSAANPGSDSARSRARGGPRAEQR